MHPMKAEAIVVTGGSGFLGALVAAALLVDDSMTVVLPVRPHHTDENVHWHIGFGVTSLGHDYTGALRDRLRVVRLSSLADLGGAPELADLRVVEMVHCAGCLDYFDKPTLEAVNVGLTAEMIALARHWQVTRFTYISTAYSCGYIEGVAAESLHGTPPEDPTDYTRTKREAERLVAESGLPFQVVRPSIVVGTSRRGAYTGKRYGVYQLWHGLERLMCRTWVPVLHVVAPERKVHLIHQDCFQRTFLSARRQLPAGTFVHLTTPVDRAPTMRQLWDLWIRECARPERVVYYQSPHDLPMREIDTRQRAFLSLAWTNLDIASRHWDFATEHVEALRTAGLDFHDDRPHPAHPAEDRTYPSRRPRAVTS
jgi:nucleoside-diphosphate-sugar epimerase